MDFKFAAVALGAKDNAVGTVTHIDRTHLGIETSTHSGQVDITRFHRHMVDDGIVAAIGITRLVDSHAAYPRLGFSFDALERVQVLDRFLDAIVGGLDGRNRTVGIPGKFLDSSRAAVTATVHVLLVMVEEETAPLEVDKAGMVGERRIVTLVHDDATPGPRTRRGITRGVRNLFGHAVGGINHVILLAALVNPRTFGVLGILSVRSETTAHVGHLDIAIERNHVFLEFGIIKLRVAPIEVSLSVVVNPYGRIDVVPVRPRKVLAVQSILERAFGPVGHGHVDGATTAGRFHGHVVVVLAVTAHHLRRPVTVLLGISAKVLVCKDERATVGPVHHIGRAGNAPTVHGKEVAAFVVASVHADRITEHDRSRVRRIIGLDNRIFCHGRGAEPETNEGDGRPDALRKLHISSLFASKRRLS